jgi:hypothetical protein
MREPERGGGEGLADASSSSRLVDHDVFNPSSHASRDPEQGQGHHSDDRPAGITRDQQTRCGGADDVLKLGPSG